MGWRLADEEGVQPIWMRQCGEERENESRVGEVVPLLKDYFFYNT